MARVQDPDGMIEFARFGSRLGDHFRAVIVASPDADGPEVPGFALYHDAKRQFCFEYGRQAWDLGQTAISAGAAGRASSRT